MATSTLVNVNERQVSYYISPQGEVGKEITEIARNAHLIAKSAAPQRTGKLAGSIQFNAIKKTGPWTGSSWFGGTARHTGWVNNGTTRIFPHGDFLLVPGRRSGFFSEKGVGGGTKAYRAWESSGKAGKRGFFFANSVAGQDGQHFLEEGLRRAMTTFKLGG